MTAINEKKEASPRDGLVASNWGGTDVEAWSSPEVFAKCDAGFAVVADVDIDIGGAVEGDRLIASDVAFWYNIELGIERISAPRFPSNSKNQNDVC